MSTSPAAPERLTSRRRLPDDARTIALVRALRKAKVDCIVELPSSPPIRVGDDPPRFRLTVQNERLLSSRLTELSLGSAYVRGDLEIEVLDRENPRQYVESAMSVFDVRDVLRSGTTVGQMLRLAGDLALSRPTRVNERAIQHHYSLGDDFYHMFLDPKYHFYSQCMFGEGPDDDELKDPDEALTKAADRKLTDMWKQLRLEKGQRILDIGAGWGGLTEYCNKRGVHVISLTLSEDSKKYVSDRTHDDQSEVILEDLLNHHRREYYDAVVIFGVIEHIPTYGRFARRVWDALKPGRRLYLDASATKQKYAASAFTRRYTWRGAHSCLALPDMIEELLFNGFEIADVRRGTSDYERTMRAWALKFDDNREAVCSRWGEYVYRSFRVFLWGGAQGFHTNRLQAYTLVAERHEKEGPRPGRLKRAAQFAASLR
jgi:cyclopropane-fatty-acyl-phospholipid synthase